MNTQCINSSTTHPKTTTTTTINHEITNNLTTTTSFFINFTQTQNIPIYIHLGMQIQHHNIIIIHFTYMNISSKPKQEFLQLNSN